MLFQRTQIEPVATQKGKLAAFPSEQLLFSVEGSAEVASRYDIRSASALMLEDTPLIQIHSDCQRLLGTHGISCLQKNRCE